MAIVKVTKSGEGIIFIDDFGNSYMTSKKYLLGHVSGRQSAPFVELCRLPMPQDPEKFRNSPVFGKDWEQIPPDDERWSRPQCSHNVQVDKRNDDGMSQKSIKERELEETYEDKEIEW